jgi:hypothetical protein
MIKLEVKRGDTVLMENTGIELVNLSWQGYMYDREAEWNGEYEDGDVIVLTCDEAPCFLNIQLDDVMHPCMVYLREPVYTLAIPFGEKRISYNPKTFTGNCHVLSARKASKEQIAAYKNLCLNEYDCHENTTCFPHASANVETRGESVFAARNAINGNTDNRRHGPWPYESWGINRDPDAEITIDFGRDVVADKIVLVTRADFPHDNWWKQAEFIFSDGTTMTVQMEKSVEPHVFTMEPKTISWIKLGKLIKDENDPSPFPALTQIEVYGTEA